jgi:Gpi18-like mannosyltransferase
LIVNSANVKHSFGQHFREIKKWVTTPSTMRSIVGVALASRILIFSVAVASNLDFGVAPPCNNTQGCGSPRVPFLDLFSRWDGEYYADISMNGYSHTVQPRWEFFPLYPTLMGSLGRSLSIAFRLPLETTVYAAGFAISNAIFFVSVYLFFVLSRRVAGNVETAKESTLLLAIYPASVFLSAVYSESLFLVLLICSFLRWFERKPIESGIFGFLATLTRPVGIFLIVPYLCEAVSNSSLRKQSRTYLPIAMVAVAYLCFMGYSQFMTGTPFANFAAEKLYWGVTSNLPVVFRMAQEVIVKNPLIIPFFLFVAVGLCSSLLTAQSSAERIVDVFSLCVLTSYLLTPIISFPRYSLTLLPIYWGLTRLSSRRGVRRIMHVILLCLLVIGTSLYVNWYSFY